MSARSRPSLSLRPATKEDVPALSLIREAAFASGPISRGMFTAGPLDAQTLALRNVETEGEMAEPGTRFWVAVLGEGAGGESSGEGLGAGVGPEAAGSDQSKLNTEAGPDTTTTTSPPTDLSALIPPRQRAGPPGPGGLPLPGSEPGTIVAWVKWIEHHAERPREEWDHSLEYSRESLGPGYNLELFGDFIAGMRDKRRELIGGEAHLLLSMLVTAPNHQGIGAGSSLVRHVLARLDTLNAARIVASPPEPIMNCWIEASPPGYPVYYHCGFRDVDVLDVDLEGKHKVKKTPEEEQNPRIWGAEYGREVGGDLRPGWFRTVMMVRKGKGGE